LIDALMIIKANLQRTETAEAEVTSNAVNTRESTHA
jgi:hypothetical protein